MSRIIDVTLIQSLSVTSAPATPSMRVTICGTYPIMARASQLERTVSVAPLHGAATVRFARLQSHQNSKSNIISTSRQVQQYGSFLKLSCLRRSEGSTLPYRQLDHSYLIYSYCPMQGCWSVDAGVEPSQHCSRQVNSHLSMTKWSLSHLSSTLSKYLLNPSSKA